MAIGGPFRELGGFLDACERTACSVNRVQVTEAAEPGEGVPIAADVELHLEPSRSESDTGCSLSSPRIDPDGTVRFALETTREIVPTAEYDVDVELLDARIDASGGGTLSLCVQPASDGDTAAGESSVPSERGPSHGDTARRNGHDRSTNSVPTATSPNDESTMENESDGDVPPFQDPELLAEVYESSDTFAEMADAIDMDVTAETVRRYMIDFDIHQPNSYRTGETGERAQDEYAESEGEGEVAGGATGSGTGEGTDVGTDDVTPRDEATARSVGTDGVESAGGVGTNADETRPEPVVLSDGLGLPDDVTADTLIETVKRSNTIYEVTQDIDLDRQDAFEMLHDLNLVDLVMGRLATEAEREITREEIVDRLREASATQ